MTKYPMKIQPSGYHLPGLDPWPAIGHDHTMLDSVASSQDGVHRRAYQVGTYMLEGMLTMVPVMTQKENNQVNEWISKPQSA